MREPDLRMGIDVGGTNTDAVVLDTAGTLLAKTKVPTSADVTSGITNVIAAILAQPGVERERITHVMLGTTHATNAVLERRKLNRVAVLRIGAPATLAVRPLFRWPDDLRAAVSGGETVVRGGIEFDGRDLVPFDAEETKRFLDSVAGSVDGVAISSVFAPVSDRHERLAAELVREVMGDAVHVSLSAEIGSVGLLERENATVLNEALVGVAHEVAGALDGALAAHGIEATTYFAQNDGTLMALEFALRIPVLTIGSGPANSMRGAAYLTGADDALVADVGGTSTDVGVLANGFPRESSQGVDIGGVRTNFRMPDILAIALGGGTIVRNGGGPVEVGPQSVGYRLREEALVFGGSTPTITDAAVAAGRARIGDAAATEAHGELLAAALARADALVADAVDRVKLAKGDRPLIVVGGGSVVVPDRIAGVSEVLRPENADVANAIGAAIAAVSGQVDRIFHPGPGGRDAALEAACDEARGIAVRAGADPSRTEIVELEEIPLAYMTDQSTRIRAKAAGPLAHH